MYKDALMIGKKAWGRIEKVLHGHKSLLHRYLWIFIKLSSNEYRL